MKSATKNGIAAAAALGAVLMAGSAVAPALADNGVHGTDGQGGRDETSKHVLLLSVDGMHQKDLDWYVKNHPTSSLAALVNHGTSYTNARTPVPSDSFPGLVGQVTGGSPGTTGVYYDDTFNRALLPAGTTDCTNTSPGAEAAFTEAANKNPLALDAGQGLSGLPGDAGDHPGDGQPAPAQPVSPNIGKVC
ncbi:MAG: alkaline phosphatase family protein [Arthrobacter sp.]